MLNHLLPGMRTPPLTCAVSKGRDECRSDPGSLETDSTIVCKHGQFEYRCPEVDLVLASSVMTWAVTQVTSISLFSVLRFRSVTGCSQVSVIVNSYDSE